MTIRRSGIVIMGFDAGMRHFEMSSSYPMVLLYTEFCLAHVEKVMPDAIPARKRPFPLFGTTEWFLLFGDSTTREANFSLAPDGTGIRLSTSSKN